MKLHENKNVKNIKTVIKNVTGYPHILMYDKENNTDMRLKSTRSMVQLLLFELVTNQKKTRLILLPIQNDYQVSTYGHGRLYCSLIESCYNLTALN